MSELRSCVKVEVAVLGSPTLIILMVSVDVKHQFYLFTPTRPDVETRTDVSCVHQSHWGP